MTATAPWPGSTRSRALAWTLAGVAALGFAVLVFLNIRRDGLNDFGNSVFTGVLLILTFVGLGTLLALRQPANPIGWLLTAGGLTWLASELAVVIARYALVDGHTTVAGRLGASFDANVWPLGIVCSVGLPLLLFPAGRTRSPRWRWVLVAMVTGCALALLASALSPSPIESSVDPRKTLVNPWGVEQLATITAFAGGLGVLILMVTMVTAVVGIIVHFVTAKGTERQQLRWVLTGAVLAIAGILSVFVGPSGVTDITVIVGLGCLPASFAVAVLRYRLYDLDRIVSRTVSYATVTGLLIATYVGLVTGVSRLLPDNSKSLAVAASTLAVAALLQPLLRRVQAVVDRRFNRSRYDSARLVEAFTVRLREQVDLVALETDLLGVVHQTMQPTSARLWLRGSGAMS